MAPVGICYRSNTYQNIGCKFNKGCIIFIICKNNRLKLQYPCIRRYQSYHCPNALMQPEYIKSDVYFPGYLLLHVRDRFHASSVLNPGGIITYSFHHIRSSFNSSVPYFPHHAALELGNPRHHPRAFRC